MTNRPSSWFSLASLPDPIGWGGMMAGVLDGQLVAAGGSQWDKPVWSKGTRLITDQIFVLTAPEAQWQISESRLPIRAAHFATAAVPDGIYFAGGLGVDGPLRSVFRLQGSNGKFVCDRLADLPEPIVYGAAGILHKRLYVIGGLPDPASKEPSRKVWSLNLDAAAESWRREPDLPAAGIFVSAAASTVDALFVFGGMQFDAAGKPEPSKAALRFDGTEWQRLADLPAARVGAVSPCPVIDENRILVAGGYADVFGGVQREHPGFPAETFVYDMKRDAWTSGPVLPSAQIGDRDLATDTGPLPMIGAPSAMWRDLMVVVSGEVRIATRSPAVLALKLPLAE